VRHTLFAQVIGTSAVSFCRRLIFTLLTACVIGIAYDGKSSIGRALRSSFHTFKQQGDIGPEQFTTLRQNNHQASHIFQQECCLADVPEVSKVKVQQHGLCAQMVGVSSMPQWRLAVNWKTYRPRLRWTILSRLLNQEQASLHLHSARMRRGCQGATMMSVQRFDGSSVVMK
jgi:hypothetical protein